MIIHKNNEGEIIFDFPDDDSKCSIKAAKTKGGHYRMYEKNDEGEFYFVGYVKEYNYQNRMKGIFYDVLEGLNGRA